ncbi:hypothetical protein SAMN02800692_2995 [Luteibacter sp. UNC138MFCol5.1]|uniref:hypothetical protein n=1 Tax=Luteibacter sp. UNC138MFCol5.1 TaxID=1502774 RepID=UPI0008D490F5|nr:hypothetical protein [Luteibacter sp. UNC138MFCol5.1]SEO95476.1 hypothetical protein SAMN02800692_2995 [Luteibacter sp. UNC138MFCol5.1]
MTTPTNRVGSYPDALPDPVEIADDLLARVPAGMAPDFLLDASVKDQTIDFLLPRAPTGVKTSDTVQLTDNGQPLGAPVLVDPYLAQEYIPLALLPADRLAERTYALNYVVTYHSAGGRQVEGPQGQQFIVDYTAPGGTNGPSAMVFAPGVADGVTQEDLESNANGSWLSATVEAYNDQQAGDRVHAYIDGVAEIGYVEVTLGEEESDIALRFPRDVLERVRYAAADPDGEFLFTYRLEDRAGNLSDSSVPVSLRLLLGPSAPWVANTVGDKGTELHLGDVPDGYVSIIAEEHGGIVGDSIAASWKPVVGSPWTSAPLPVQRPNYPVTIPMPVADANLRTGSVDVTYARTGVSGEAKSLARTLNVIGLANLLPVDVREADGIDIALAEVPPAGATLIAAVQALIPAGSAVTFEWKAVDASGASFSDRTTVYANGMEPTEARLPLSDLQQAAGSIDIRYTADPDAATRLAQEAPWSTFNVIASGTGYPPPTVAEAPEGMLDPANATEGAHVVVDADLIASDSVTLLFGSDEFGPYPGSKPLTVLIPASLIRSLLGQSVQVAYRVTRNGIPDMSAPLDLTIGTFEDEDDDLPTPVIDRAIAGELDMTTFDGDPQVLVTPWPLISAGETVWLRVTGTLSNGGTDTIALYAAQSVTPAMVTSGLAVSVPRARLLSLKDGSDVTVTCKVDFGGTTVESAAVLFPTSSYRLRLKSGGLIGGRAFELEEFEDPTSAVANGDTYRMRFCRITPVGGRLQKSTGSNSPYLLRACAYLSESTDVTARIVLDHPAIEARLGVRPPTAPYTTTVVAYDAAHQVIDRHTLSLPGWAEFASPSTRPIASLEVLGTGNHATWFDNLSIRTGAAWDEITDADPRCLETFDDLPLERHGDHYEFDRWHVNVGGTGTQTGEIEILVPGGLSTKALGVHMRPYGTVHQFTPQFAVCPRVSTRLRIHASESLGRSVTVFLVYTNRYDPVFRTVSKTVSSLGTATQNVTFSTSSEVAGNGEYVSHIRVVVNGTPSRNVTIYYDDIEFRTGSVRSSILPPAHTVAPRANAFNAPFVPESIDGHVVIDTSPVTVACEVHDGLKGDLFHARWYNDPATETPAFETKEEALPRDHYPMTFIVPLAEAALRPGDIIADYVVRRGDETFISQPTRLKAEVIARLQAVEVDEANGDDVIELGTLPDHATVRAPAQPELVPAGRKVTFAWEGKDADGVTVGGTNVAWSNGQDDTTTNLPRADLERVGSMAIRYTVTNEEDARDVAMDALVAPWRTYRIASTGPSWPLPDIIELSAGVLTPTAARRGATCYIDAALVPTDEIVATFGGFTSSAVAGARPLRIVVPPGDVARHLGRDVDVAYTVTRNGSTSSSPPLTIHVQGFTDDDGLLHAPAIDGANAGILDLTSFEGVPEVTVAPWLLIDPRQRVMLSIEGESADGSVARVDLLAGAPVDPAWVTSGLRVPVAREMLLGWRDRSTIDVVFAVQFDSATEATRFPKATYVLRTGAIGTPGRAWECDDFADIVVLDAQRQVQSRFCTLRQRTGVLEASFLDAPWQAALAPFAEGMAARMTKASAVTVIELDRPAASIRLGVAPDSRGSVHVIAFDDEGEQVGAVDRDHPAWVAFDATDGGPGLRRLELWSTVDGEAYFDNLLVGTGEPWRWETEPVREGFDDLEDGTYDARLELPLWSIKADSTTIEVTSAPAGMSGKAVAIHMNPGGHVHQITPRFAIRPNREIRLLVRGVVSEPYDARFRAVYFNTDDLTLRPVELKVEIGNYTRVISISEPGDLPRPNELLSHVSVSHGNGTHAATVYYDDLSMELNGDTNMNPFVAEVIQRHADARTSTGRSGANAPRAMAPPWVRGTVDDLGLVLRLEDLAKGDAQVDVYSHEGVKGESIRVRWQKVGTESFETGWQTLTRDGEPLLFTIPYDKVSARIGDVNVRYEVEKMDGTSAFATSQLTVEGTPGVALVEVVEAEDGKIVLADLPAAGATLSAPHQPELIPAGSAITFLWKGSDANNNDVTGFAKGYSDGHTPFQRTMPMSDLQRMVGRVEIYYEVEQAVRRSRGFLPRTVKPRAHLVSDIAYFDIVGAAGYPAPTVLEASTGMLRPVDADKGATVAIDADLVATDSVKIFFGPYSTTVAGSASLRVVVPAGEIAALLGQAVEVYYAVTRAGKTTQSEKLPLTIGYFEDGDLPVPRIDMADPDTFELNLGNFDGDPNVVVDPWPLIAVGQTVWASVDGVRSDGSTVNLSVLAGEPVTTSMLGTGVQGPVARLALEAWKDDSELTVTCKINFAGGPEAAAVTLDPMRYRLVRGGGGGIVGREFEHENFNDPVASVANGDWCRMRFFSIRPSGGPLKKGTTSSASPYIDGNAVLLQETQAAVTCEVALDHPAVEVHLGVKPASTSIPTEVIAYDGTGAVIERVTPGTTSWVRFISDSSRPVATLKISSQSGTSTYFDNLIAFTGSTWDIIDMDSDPRCRETFDDVPLGKYGNHFEFDRWHVSIDGLSNRDDIRDGNIEIGPAPSGMFGRALAVHMQPYGRIHHLTPQFAACPRIETSFYIRSTSSALHRASVTLVYVDFNNKTVRTTAAKSINLDLGIKHVVFSATTEVARDTEYLSHIRVAIDQPTLPATIFYDDIVLR